MGERSLRERLGLRLDFELRRLCARPLVIDGSNRFSRENLGEFLEREIAALERRPGRKRVLNVGAGGLLAQRVSQLRDCAVVQLDLSPKRRPDLVADVGDLRCFPDACFDAVFLLEVLEHVARPERAIAELLRVLIPDGQLVLSTPFAFEIHEAPADYFRFTEHGLRLLLRDFRSCRVERRNGYLKALLVPLLRLTRSRHAGDRLIGLAALFASLALKPLIDLCDRAIRSDALTTGYVVACRK